MLPPKKNQAVRDEHKDREENEQKEKALEKAKAAKAAAKKEESDGEEEEEVYVNIFENTMVEGKRKQFVNKHDQVLKEWMKVHFEEKEGRKCAISQCYSQYLKLCVREEINNAIAEFEFGRMIRKTFPNGFGLKDDSPLKGEVLEHKHSVVKKNKVKADTLKLKTKDVIHQAFDGLNNPVDGIMFNTLKKYMIVKFPALQLDIRPKVLLRGLETGVYHGYVELLRGVGRSGRYRWYDPEKHEAEMKERKMKKKGEVKSKDGKKEDGEGSADSAEEGGEKKADGAEEDENKKESADDSTESAAEEKKPKRKAGAKKKKPAGKKGKPKPKKTKSYRKFIVHSDPQRIEDTFPLALTFMAEPKETSFSKILNYIDKFYDVDIKPEKLQKVLEKGSEKGYWQLVRGSNRGAVYQLTVDTFDPTDDDDLIGKVVNAIMASVDPKSCSARALKEYVTEFHPEYQIPDKPYLFKKSLQRGLTKNLLRQVTGIGASGTFELAESFVPSPVVLAGKDTATDYEESEESDVDSDEGMISDSHDVDVSQFLDAYKPRPTKRRGKVREVTKSGSFDKNAAYIEAQLKQAKQASRRKPKKRPASSTLKVPKKKARADSSDDEAESSSEEEEEEESNLDDEVESTYGSDTAEKYRPRPSSSRGGPPRGKATPAKKQAKGKKSAPTKKSKAKSKREPTPPPTPKKTPRKAPTQRSEPPPAKGKSPAAKGKSPATKGKSPAGRKPKRKRN